MNKQISRSLVAALVLFASALGMRSTAFGAATITILNNDAAGVGFNDATPAAPVGGNSGTTLGQQRLIAFQAAATKHTRARKLLHHTSHFGVLLDERIHLRHGCT